MDGYCVSCAKEEPEVSLRWETFTDHQTKRTCRITICAECNAKARRLDAATWSKIRPFLQ